MRTAAILSLALIAGACQREPAKPATPAETPAAPASQPSAASEIPKTASPQLVEGWRTDQAAYPLLGLTIPAFTAKLHGGGETGKDKLKGRWTILAFWGLWSDDSIADARYIRALSSAADQDPDLDFLSIHMPPALGQGSAAFGAFKSLDDYFKGPNTPWPTAIDADGKIADDFKITGAPIYLLVGPDLTVEGWRTDLDQTPDDGIKSVIRGVAAIKKQIAAPG